MKLCSGCKLDPNYRCVDRNTSEKKKQFNLFTKEMPNTTIKVCMWKLNPARKKGSLYYFLEA